MTAREKPASSEGGREETTCLMCREMLLTVLITKVSPSPLGESQSLSSVVEESTEK